MVRIQNISVTKSLEGSKRGIAMNVLGPQHECNSLQSLMSAINSCF